VRGKRAIVLISLLLIGLIVGLGSVDLKVGPQATLADEQPNKLPSSYKFTAVTSSEGHSVILKFWIKNRKVKIDMMEVPSGQRLIMIITKDGSYIYYPKENRAMKSAFLSSQFESLAEPFGKYYYVNLSDEAILASIKQDPGVRDARIVGQRDIAGKRCTIFEVNYTDNSQAKIWVTADRAHRYPLKIETTNANGTTALLKFKDVELNPMIPDSEFELPPGVKVEESSF
jgi:outer membrane lipoprotein-sorting protein